MFSPNAHADPAKATKMRSKVEIPGIAIVAIIIVFIVLGAKGIKYVLSNTAGDQPLETNQKIKSAERINPETFSAFSGIAPARSFSDYQVVIEHDLLKPLGWQKTIALPAPPQPVVRREWRRERPAPTSDLILTGIVRLGDESIAIVEDTSKGEGYFLREGDKLKDYVVEDITEENIVLAKENSKLMTALGSRARYSSTGQILMSGLADEQATSENPPSPLYKGGKESNVVETTGEESSLLDESSASLSIIERMKARRRKELGPE
jgi:hypothetical protein